MKTVLIAGGSGLIGTRLSEMLQAQGYEVRWLSRKPEPNNIYKSFIWNPHTQTIDINALIGVDTVINLAGAGIADKRWTLARKKLIIESRTSSTKLLFDTLTTQKNTATTYLSASAIGFYGDRGNDLMTENSTPGTTGFLTESTIAWENAVAPFFKTNIRTAVLRIGIVLSKLGGALPELEFPFKFGVGAYFGRGKAWYSCVHIDDVCRMFIWAIENKNATGFYNAVMPNPIMNYDLTKVIGAAKNKSFIYLPVPTLGLRIIMGEMASVVLNSTKVVPEHAVKEGFIFLFPNVFSALQKIYEK